MADTTTKEPTTGDELAEALAKLAAIEAENKKLKADNEKLNPTFDFSKFIVRNEEDARRILGKRGLEMAVHGLIASENKELVKRSLPPINLKDDPDRFEELALQVLNKMVFSWTIGPTELPRRVVKMVKPTKTKETNFKADWTRPVLVEIPMESQVNNMAGSLADGIVRYTNKGYKMANPVFCSRNGCNEAALVEKGLFVHDGYCTESHRAEVEKRPKTSLESGGSVITGDTIASYARV